MSVSPDDTGFLSKLTAPFGGAGNLGLALLANSGYSQTPRTFGQTLGISALQAQQAAVQRNELQKEQEMNELRKRYMQAQIQAMQAKPAGNQPSSVAEYEYAKANGYKGSFEDWQTRARQLNPTADMQNFQFYQTLSPEMQKQFTSLQRQPTVPQLSIVNGVPTLVDRVNGTTRPLSSLESEASSGARLARDKAEGTAIGTATGEVTGGILKKGGEASAVISILDLADPLIDAATGSVAGAARDKLVGAFGYAPQGAQATSQLQILQAGLMLNQPRMEGPQGVLDVKLYEQMAGQIGDPTVPRDKKKAAIQTIRQLQEKYQERAASVGGAPPSSGTKGPKRIQNDADYDALPSGAQFVGPDGKTRRKP